MGGAGRGLEPHASRPRGRVREVAPPDRNDEYAFYQLLLGAWPPALCGPRRHHALDALRLRLEGRDAEVMREAKLHTTWAAPTAAYEEAVSTSSAARSTPRANPFLEAFPPSPRTSRRPASRTASSRRR